MVTYPKDWKECRLLERVSLVQGLTYTPENVKACGTLVLRSSNIQDGRLSLDDNVYVDYSISEEKQIQDNDILVCVRNGSSALIGKSCILRKIPNTTFGAFMSVLRGDETGYIAKIFAHDIVQSQVRDRSNATINQITKKDFESIKIAIPPIAEQKAIAATLSSFDTHIDNLTALIEKKKAIRDGALSDLMSGRARLVGFNGEWGETTLGEAGRFISGNGFPVSYQGHTSGKYPFYKVSDFNKSGNEYCLIAANNYVSEEVAGKLNCNVIPSDSIVFAKIGAAIFLERKRITNSDCCIDNNMMAFNILEGNCPRYFCYLLQEMNLSDYSCITALPSLSGKTLGKVAIHLPGVDEQKAIADILTSMDTEIQNLEAERDKMQAIRAGAMDDLLTGRVRLPM